jgi:hypothetical protein
MQISDQLHVLASLPPGEKFRFPLDRSLNELHNNCYKKAILTVLLCNICRNILEPVHTVHFADIYNVSPKNAPSLEHLILSKNSFLDTIKY